MANKQSNNLATLPQLSDETVKNLVANQAQELQLRGQQLALQKENLAHNKELAIQSIAAQKEDRADARIHERCLQRNRFIFIGIAIFLAVASVCVLAWIDKDQLAMECVKLAATFATGAIGGYAVAKVKSQKEEEKDEDESD